MKLRRNELYSSRQIEIVCKRDINFISLLNGQKAPDYNTIATFRVNHLEKCIDNLFSQLVIKLCEMDEIAYKVIKNYKPQKNYKILQKINR